MYENLALLAAFILVAAAIVPHSRVTVSGLGLNETRTGLMDLLRAMGAELAAKNKRLSAGEPIGDVTTHFADWFTSA